MIVSLLVMGTALGILCYRLCKFDLRTDQLQQQRRSVQSNLSGFHLFLEQSQEAQCDCAKKMFILKACGITEFHLHSMGCEVQGITHLTEFSMAGQKRCFHKQHLK